MLQLSSAIALALAALAFATLTAPAAAPPSRLRLATSGCVDAGRLAVRLPARANLVEVRFSVGGRSVRVRTRGVLRTVLRGRALRDRLVLRGLRAGSRLHVRARTRGGRILTASRLLRACRAGEGTQQPARDPSERPASPPRAPGTFGADGRVAPNTWPAWQYDARGSRSNPTESKITPANVGSLELKWAFAFPGGVEAASSQPAVVDGLVYVGGRDGVFYALEARTGRERWSFDTAEVVGPGGGNGLRNGATVAGGSVFFGDSKGFLYALDAASGKLRWATEVDPYPAALMTGSPLVYGDRVYSGVSSGEVFTGGNPAGECCQFRGNVVALDRATGKLVWRYYTVEKPKPNGTNSYGAARFEPSGVAVWNSPAIDPETNTLFFGTSQNYTGATERADSMFAMDARTGVERWHRQMTFPDAWTTQCLFPVPGGNCPNPGPDHDFGSSANVFDLGGRLVVGQGQKSGVYHLLDARTGNVIWQNKLSDATGPGGPGGQTGIQWGSSYDGEKLYVATNNASPGKLHALDPRTGRVLWATEAPADGCSTGGAATSRPGDCGPSFPAAVSTTPGLVWEGGRDGKMRAFSSANGRILWSYDTIRPFVGVNGAAGKGGSINGAGAAIADGMVYVNSGYSTANTPFTGINGNVLLAFGPKG